jgi:hypothetical protein
MKKYRQTALPAEYTRTSGKPSEERYRGAREGGGNGGSGGGNSTNPNALIFSSNVVTVTLQPNENFQLLNGNPKRKYLSITAVIGDTTIAFGRAISQSTFNQEYLLATTNSLVFDSNNAPTSTVNIGTNDPASPATITVSVLEGVAP